MSPPADFFDNCRNEIRSSACTTCVLSSFFFACAFFSSVFTIVEYAFFVSRKNTSAMTLLLCNSASVSMQFMIRSCESSSMGTAENLDCPTRMIEVMINIDSARIELMAPSSDAVSA